MSQPLVLLDARGLMLRAYHGSSDTSRVNSEGKPIASWERGLSRFIEDTLIYVLDGSMPPSRIIAVWDGGNSFRTTLFPDYKKARMEKPRDPLVTKELAELKEACMKLMAYTGIRSVYVPGEEADDLIALLVEKLDYNHCTIRTNDGDLTQLISPKVSIWLGRNFLDTSSKGYKGTSFALVPLWKALVGDSSDGYLGVPQFGEKAYKRLADAYGEDGLQEILQALEANNWKPVQEAFDATQDRDLQKLLEHWSQAHLCVKLARLHPEACYGNLDGRKPKKPVWLARVPNREKVLEILADAGSPGRVGMFEKYFPAHRLLTTADAGELPQIMQEVLSSPVVSWDYESSDKLKHPAFQTAKKGYVDVLSQELAGVSVNYGRFMEKTFYLPVDHKDTDNFPREWVAWLLQSMDQREERSIVQNASFELTVSMTNLGFMPRAPFDTKIMASYVDEDADHGLKDLSLHSLGYRQTSYAEVTQGRDMCELTGEEVLSYGCDDSLVTSHLFTLFRDIMQCEGSWDFYQENEIDPAINDALDFIDGTDIDFPLLAEFAKESEISIKENAKIVRDGLTQHCRPDCYTDRDMPLLTQRALTLHQEWLSTKGSLAAEDPEAYQKLSAETWEKAWSVCFYQPRHVETVITPFAPTVTGLNRILGLIDPKAPKLKKASAAGVEELDGLMMDYIATEKPAARERLEEFLSLLYAAKKKLSASGRSGPEYEALEDFGREILVVHGHGKQVATGDELNMGSPVQMQALLYGKLGLPIRKRSKVTKGSKRDEEDLQGSAAVGLKAIAAAFVYDLPEGEDWRKDVLEGYRKVALEQQNQSLYYKPYPLWVHPRDGKIHPGIMNCGTVTRRPTGSSPNPLQISKSGPLRRAFIGGTYEGDTEPRVVVSADVAGQEAVVTGVESGDRKMMEIFTAEPRGDFHSMTSSGFAHLLLPRMGIKVNGPITYEEFLAGLHNEDPEIAKVYKNIRGKYGKGVGFALLYGGGYTTIAENLLIPKDFALEIFEGAHRVYSGLKSWQERTASFGREHGYTLSPYGTRRHAPADLWSDENGLRMRAERQVTNFLAQGTSADMLKVARQAIYDRNMREKYRMRATAPIYDEIRSSVPISLAIDYMEELDQAMSITPPGYPVGMQIEFSVGWNWGEKIEIGLFSREAAEKALAELQEKAHAN
jgi:DNA polymerase I-like protein with 3'-5' exonuclease and polymerase domains/5'-3' exonuclease